MVVTTTRIVILLNYCSEHPLQQAEPGAVPGGETSGRNSEEVHVECCEGALLRRESNAEKLTSECAV